MEILIGIDDTDNLHTRGTGYRARQLVEKLHENNLAQTIGVTRHQLLFDDRVPYTSHNSSACIAVKLDSHPDELINFCKSFLLSIAAEGSDVGLCMADLQQAHSVAEFGKLAKTELVTQTQAEACANAQGIHLYGLTGDHQGIIGALSACGLYSDGDDGRYIWAPGIREHANQTLSMEVLLDTIKVDCVSEQNGNKINTPEATIALGPWPRPVRIDQQSVLLVEKVNENHYKVLDKDVIKSIRP